MNKWIVLVSLTCNLIVFGQVIDDGSRDPVEEIDDMTIPPQIFLNLTLEEDQIIFRREKTDTSDPNVGFESQSSLMLKLPYNGKDSVYTLDPKQVTVDYYYFGGLMEFVSHRIRSVNITVQTTGELVKLTGEISVFLEENVLHKEIEVIRVGSMFPREKFIRSSAYKLPAKEMQIDEDETVYQITELEAEFPGGYEALLNYFKENMNYPEDAKEANIQGRVYISVIIEKDGSIGEVQILRGIYSSIDKEAKRLAKEMPKWIPAENGGRNVRARVNLPITFKIE